MKVQYRIHTKELLTVNSECFWGLRLLDMDYFTIDKDNDYEFVRQVNSFDSEEEAVNKLTELLQLKKEGKSTFSVSNDWIVIQKEYYL